MSAVQHPARGLQPHFAQVPMHRRPHQRAETGLQALLTQPDLARQPLQRPLLAEACIQQRARVQHPLPLARGNKGRLSEAEAMAALA